MNDQPHTQPAEGKTKPQGFHNPPPFNVIVFADSQEGERLLLVRVDEARENAATQAVASGLHYAGAIAVNDGVPSVQIEPGFAGVVALAGVGWAGAFGEHLKEHQLRLLAEAEAAG